MGTAWDKCVVDENGVKNVVTLQCFPVIFERFLIGFLILAGTTAVIMIIIAAIRFIFSGGDAKQVESARNVLTFAIVGLVVVLLAGFIVSLVAYITGVPCLNLAGFTNCQ